MSSELTKIPKCPNCGIYLLIGFLTGIDDLAAEHNWKIGPNRNIPMSELDACATGCVCHSCPRCRTDLDSYLDNFLPDRIASRDRELQIQNHPTLGNTPSRINAKYTEDNDHNPMIREECPNCNGSGQDLTISFDESTFNCPQCAGLGYTGVAVKCFTNEKPILPVQPNKHGWIECPHCNQRFLPTDKNAWTGLRHRKCGQKIAISGPDDA